MNIKEQLEFILKEYTKDGGEGCINCEFNEYKDGQRNYCSEHNKTVTDYDEVCEDYCEQGSI